MANVLETINLMYGERAWNDRINNVALMLGERYETKETNIMTMSLTYVTALILGIFIGIIAYPYVPIP